MKLMPDLDNDLRALQEVRDAVRRAGAACKESRSWDQARTDSVCQMMANAAAGAAGDLARLAVDETEIGRVHYKILKNLFAAEGSWESIRGEKTVGVVSRDDARGIYEVATPVGVVAGIIPTTNPTSTAIFKALIAVKGRNAIVLSPHPRAKRCIAETAEVLRRAIERAGGPPDLVQCLSNPTIESTGALMKDRGVALILATGGGGLVRAAYSSGKPAYGVGPGNVPCYVDRSADLAAAARWVTASQSFDNATLCCSEQALVLDEPIADKVLNLFVERGAHLLNDQELGLLGAYANQGGMMNADVVGKDPYVIARAAGFEVPRETTILLCPQGGVGREWPLSIELLCPLLSVHRVGGWEEGCEVSTQLLKFGGLGHTLSLWAREEEVVEAFMLEKPASRILVNGPSSQGAVGFSSHLMPSFSLGCGPQAGNITSDNITAKHLINLKRAARLRRDWEEIDQSSHERARSLGGEDAPRGSGLRGDPALEGARGGGSAIVTPAPAVRQKTTSPRSPSPKSPSVKPASAVKETRPALQLRESRAALPSFTRPTGGGSSSAVMTRPAPAVKVEAKSSPKPVHVGAALNTSEIQSIMSQAGAGCPMGPCAGCPHHEVTTGACKA
jgi:acetaldehyde dehydrogenase (acetylating)